jgi:hypothetical protein
MITSFIVAVVVLIVSVFAVWYSTRISYIKNVSIIKSFLTILITFISMGFLKIFLIKMNLYSPAFLLSFGFFVFYISLKLFFKQGWVKTFLIACLSIIVMVIMIIPIFVVGGALQAYFQHVK